MRHEFTRRHAHQFSDTDYSAMAYAAVLWSQHERPRIERGILIDRVGEDFMQGGQLLDGKGLQAIETFHCRSLVPRLSITFKAFRLASEDGGPQARAYRMPVNYHYSFEAVALGIAGPVHWAQVDAWTLFVTWASAANLQDGAPKRFAACPPRPGPRNLP